MMFMSSALIRSVYKVLSVYTARFALLYALNIFWWSVQLFYFCWCSRFYCRKKGGGL